MKQKKPLMPEDYSSRNMILIGLAVLSLGLAIAYIGLVIFHH